MKSIRETLHEIAAEDSYLESGATIYVVIDDHRRQGEEPHVKRVLLSEEKLARSNDRRIIKIVVQNALGSLLKYWRGEDV